MANAIQWISVNKTNYAIHWVVIYPLDSVIHLWDNWAEPDDRLLVVCSQAPISFLSKMAFFWFS